MFRDFFDAEEDGDNAGAALSAGDRCRERFDRLVDILMVFEGNIDQSAISLTVKISA